MPVSVRRFLYALLAALGLVLMVPLMVNVRRFQGQFRFDPAGTEVPLDPSSLGWNEQLASLFLLGFLLAGIFLYAALSTGYPKAWRPHENGEPRCARCGSAVRFGVRRCESCQQQLVW